MSANGLCDDVENYSRDNPSGAQTPGRSSPHASDIGKGGGNLILHSKDAAPNPHGFAG